MDTEEIHKTNDMSTSSDEGHYTDESMNQNAENSLAHDIEDTYKIVKATDNGNIIFDFEGNFVFPSYERDTLDWDSFKTIGYTSDHNSNGIYEFCYTDLATNSSCAFL